MGFTGKAAVLIGGCFSNIVASDFSIIFWASFINRVLQLAVSAECFLETYSFHASSAQTLAVALFLVSLTQLNILFSLAFLSFDIFSSAFSSLTASRSSLVTTIRRYFLGTHPTCLVCSKKSQQIHHLAYDARTLLGLEDMNLVALCESCHYLIEFDSHDRKRDLPEVNSTLLSMCSTPSQMLWAKKWKDFVKQQQGKKHKPALLS